MRDLSLSGVPVEGEAGVGYRLSKGFDLPPIMFTFDEVEAMVTGARMVEAWGGPALAMHARSALAKIALALPPARREEIARSRLFAPGFHIRPEAAASLETARQAILQRRKLRVEYVDSTERASLRTIRPMAVYFWGTTWTLAAVTVAFPLAKIALVELESTTTLPDVLMPAFPERESAPPAVGSRT